MRGGISERPDARRVRRLNLSQETMFLFLLAPGEISGQLMRKTNFVGGRGGQRPYTESNCCRLQQTTSVENGAHAAQAR